MGELLTSITGILILLLLFVSGMEIAFAMALVGFFGFAHIVSFRAASDLLVKDFYDAFTTYGYTVIPLFVLMGQIAANSRIARRLYESANKLVGHIPGGLAFTTVIGATLFKAICGSTLATVAAFSGIAIPEMEKHKYDKKFAAGIVASVGTIGVLLPPCITLIVFAIIVELSIGKMFLAGIIPALTVSFLFMIVIFIWVKIRPGIAPITQKAPIMERLKAIPEILWIVVIFGLMIGGIMKGIFTPTEAGSIGVFLVFLYAMIRRDLNFKVLIKSFDEALRTACMVIILIAASNVFGHFLQVAEITRMASEWITSLQINRNVVMVLIMLVYLIGGTFIDDLAFMIMATPLLYPAIINLGFDPLWFGIMVALTLMIGVIIPPVAICVFVVKNITGMPFGLIYKGVLPFLLALVACIILMFFLPEMATYLPNRFMG